MGNVLLASSQHASALGDWPQAQLHAEAALLANREIGIPSSEAADLCMLSECARERGDPPSALSHADAALVVYTRLSDQYGQAMAWEHIGHAQRVAGAWAEALAGFEKTFTLYDAVDDLVGRRSSLAQVAEAHLECGNAPLALPLVERVLHEVEHGDDQEGGIRLALICHRVFEAMQDPRADRLLVHAHSALQTMAARIEDATIRARMLRNVSAHRAVTEAWSRRTVAAPAP